MPILLVDAGNTCIKWCYLERNVISKQQCYYYNDQSPISLFSKIVSKKREGCTKVLLVSVLGNMFNDKAAFISKTLLLGFKNIKSKICLANVRNSYVEPEKLGADRFVAMIAAYHLVNNDIENKKPCIIIDSGTATTIDAVDASGNHLGGMILPGLNLCQSSLLDNTQQLFDWTRQGLDITPTVFAKETTEAIISASIFGLSGAIDNICNKMEKEICNHNQKKTVERVICGGGAKDILPYMDSEYFHQQDLIMIGLSVIVKTEKVSWH